MSTADLTFLESVAIVVGSALERARFDRSRERAEARLRELVERLPAVTYRAGLGAKGNWHYVSPQVEDLLGLSPGECMADNDWWEKRVHPDDLPSVLAEEERTAADGRELDITYRMRAEDGRTVWVRDRASLGRPSEDGGEIVVEGLIFDITAQKEAEARLRYLADHDALTDLLNRRGFEAAVRDWLDRAGPRERAGLAVLDLDHMKRVNDSLGHGVGDEVLRQMAARIGSALREGDVFARLGGDEFGLFLPGLDARAAKRRFEELVALIRRGQDGMPTITVSTGAVIASGESGGDAVGELLTRADIALWEAKDRGRDRVAFAGEDEHAGLRWVSEIRESIEDDRLVPYAQPIVDLASGEHHAYELLARMIDRHGEVVPARDFISTAERFGLIRKVDRWSAGRAIEGAAAGLRLCVNISAASISDSELTDHVAGLLERAPGVDPGLITFEITETLAAPPIDTLRGFAQRVEELGCQLSLDDVGTGFGTLLYLRSLPFSQLKIDTSFVRGMRSSPTDAGIVRSLVIIGRELGQRTIAEGVEQAEVADALRELGVDYAQGCFLGEPAPIDELLSA